jgi:hypothetical protein
MPSKKDQSKRGTTRSSSLVLQAKSVLDLVDNTVTALVLVLGVADAISSRLGG